MDRSYIQKFNKATVVLNSTMDHLDLIYIYRTFHRKTGDYTIFSSAHGIFSRTDHMLGHRKSLNKFKRTEIISSIFSKHNAMKLDINHRKKNEKRKNTWRLNNKILKIQWVTNEIKEIRKYLKTKENENITLQNL